MLTDFGAEKGFGAAAEQLWEHYGFRLHRDSVRGVVKQQAQRAEDVVGARHRAAVIGYRNGYRNRQGPCSGEEVLIAESDGSFVRTGKLELASGEGKTPKRGLLKRRRQTQWREARLSVVEHPDKGERLGQSWGHLQRACPESPKGGRTAALALLMGWGEQTQVHAVSDGAPWIAQQMAEVFPRHCFLLDRYHLLEHLHTGAYGLRLTVCAQEWVDSQLARIDEGKVGRVIKECKALAGGDSDHPLMDLARYLDNRRDQLDYTVDYTGAKQHGLPIGSGVVEGGHRHVIQSRMKLPGAWWNEETLNPMLALRTLRANGWWDDFWNQSRHF